MRAMPTKRASSRVAPVLFFLALAAVLSAGTASAQWTLTTSILSPNSGNDVASPAVNATPPTLVASGSSTTASIAPGTSAGGVPYQQFEYQLAINGGALGALKLMPFATNGRNLSTSVVLGPYPDGTTVDIEFTVIPKYNFTIGNAGPADPTFSDITHPAINRYVVAGTTSPPTGYTEYAYNYGDQVICTVAAPAAVNKDYKFGEDVNRNGIMELQTTNPTSGSLAIPAGLNKTNGWTSDGTTASPFWKNGTTTGDVYWLVTSSGPGSPSLAALAPPVVTVPPQTCTVTVRGDTVVTAWFTRAARIAWLPVIAGMNRPFRWSYQPAGYLDMGPLFTGENGDGHVTIIGTSDNSLYDVFGPAAQLVFEDTATVDGTYGGDVAFQYVDSSGQAGTGNIPTATQPVSTINAGNGKTSYCSQGPSNPLIMDIAINTGKPGAILFTPYAQPATQYVPAQVSLDLVGLTSTLGAVQFGPVQIDRMGVGYELQLRYTMIRADDQGTTINPTATPPDTTTPSLTDWPPDPAVTEAIPALNSGPFNVGPGAPNAESGANFAWGYNYFGQLGIGVITPPNPNPNFIGLPLQVFHPGQYTPTTDATITDLDPSEDIVLPTQGPVGMPGDYTQTYPHMWQQSGFIHHFAGWQDSADTGGFLTSDLAQFSDWWARGWHYPDDEFQFGRDMLEPVEPWHQAASQWWHSDQNAFNAAYAGRMHSLALRDDGSLYAWGDNEYGQLGFGANAVAPYTTPVGTASNGTPAYPDPRPLSLAPLYDDMVYDQYGTLSDCVGAAAGFDHSIAVEGNGTVWTWGRNNWGQLGYGTQDDNAGGHPTPAQVQDANDPTGFMTNVAAVAAGDYFSLALKRDGSVWAWGLNLDGQLGDGSKTNRFNPVQVGIIPPSAGALPPFLMTRFVDPKELLAKTTQAMTCATTSPDGAMVATASYDGSVKLWNPITGALIRTIADATDAGPNAHTGPINYVTFSPLSSASYYILTCSTDRTAKLWYPDGTFLCNFVDTSLYNKTNTTDAHAGSVTCVAFSPSFTAAGGMVATCSVDGTAKIWSVTISGGVATPTLMATASEPVIPPNTGALGINAVVFSPGGAAFYTASSDQTVDIWTLSGSLEGSCVDHAITPGAFAHTGAVTSLAVISSNGNDLLVSGSQDCTAKLWTITGVTAALTQPLASLFDGNIGNTVSLMGHTAPVLGVGIAQDTTVTPANTYVLTGSIDTTVKRWLIPTTPVAFLTPDESYMRHADWINHVEFGRNSNGSVNVNLILTAAGSVLVNEDNSAKLGLTPVVVSVDGGTAHCLAVKEDGTVWSWGFNGTGQLGQGTAGPAVAVGGPQLSVVPGQVQDPSDPTGFLQLGSTDPAVGLPFGVTAGNGHSAAVKNDGSIRVWGSNEYGELGQGTEDTPGSPTVNPTPVQPLINATTPLPAVMQAVSAGWGYTLARGSGGITISGAGSTAVNGHYTANSSGVLALDGSGGSTTLSNTGILSVGGANYYMLANSDAGLGNGTLDVYVNVQGAGAAGGIYTYMNTDNQDTSNGGFTGLNTGAYAYVLMNSGGATTLTFNSATGLWIISNGLAPLYQAPGSAPKPPTSGWTMVGGGAAPTVQVGAGVVPGPTIQQGAVYAWGHNNHGQLGIDGPGITPQVQGSLPADQLYSTFLPSPTAPAGYWLGNAAMSSVKARYWHSQMVNFSNYRYMHWHMDPPNGGVVIPYTAPYNTATTAQTGVPAQTLYTFSTPTAANSETSGTLLSESGTVIRLLAIARPGYSFDHWDGYAPSQLPETSWIFNNYDPQGGKTMDSTAHFDAVPLTYSLVIQPLLVGGGPATGAVVTGAGTYNQNAVVTLTATGTVQYQFDHWSGDPQIANSKEATVYLLMNGENVTAATQTETVTAWFTTQSYSVTVAANPKAASTPTLTPAVGPYAYGSTVNIDAPANPSYVFNDWTFVPNTNGPIISNGVATDPSSAHIVVIGNTALTANFTQRFTVNVTIPQGTTAGTVNGLTPSYTTTVNSGTAVVLNAAATGAPWQFVNWTGDVSGGTLSANGTVLTLPASFIQTFTSGTLNIQANFSNGTATLYVQSLPLAGIPITSTTGQGGSTNYTPAVASGTQVTLTTPPYWPLTGATPATTYYFTDWTLNGTAQASGMTTVSFNMGTTNQTAVANYALETTPPTVPSGEIYPQPGSIQNAPDTALGWVVTDAESGVDFTKVTITVNGSVIYNGAAENPVNVYQTTGQAVSGVCYRAGTTNDTTFTFVPTTRFAYDQTVRVVLTAANLAGITMTPLIYTFQTQLPTFSANIQVNTDTGTQHRPATTYVDAAGDLYMFWDNNSQIWFGDSPINTTTNVNSDNFGTSVAISTTGGTQTATATVLVAPGVFYTVWQDNRSGHYDIRGAINSGVWAQIANPLASTGANQTNPTIAADGNGKIYVAWEDTSLGNVSNIFVTYSSDNGITWQNPPIDVSPSTAAQTHPSMAIDMTTNNVYLVWSDARNVTASHGNDIFGANSTDGSLWHTTPVVSSSFNHTAPALAIEQSGAVLHLAWVGNETGNQQIYYAKTNGGLPATLLTGVDVVDDAKDNNGLPPAIAVTGLSSNSTAAVFIAWTDSRNVTAQHPQDTDIYFCEVVSGVPSTNILINDDKNLATQQYPCIGVDVNGNPYIAWEDNRTGTFEIWFATVAQPTTATTLSATAYVTAAGGTVSVAGASVVIPAAALTGVPAPGFPITVAEIVATPDLPTGAIGMAFSFGPSGLSFIPEATITIPIPAGTKTFKTYNAYWYDPMTGTWDTSGISNVMVTATAITFQTDHFTTFAVTGTGTPVTVSTGGGGGGGGGCFIATSAYESLPGLAGTLEVNSTGRYVLRPDDARKLDDIRGLRDDLLLNVPEGRAFSAWYYAIGPYAAVAERNNETAKRAVRAVVLDPLSKLLEQAR